MDLDKIGNFIYELRIKKGFTKEQLAKKINVRSDDISKMEDGNGFSDILVVEPLAKELGVSPLELLRGEYIKNNDKIDREDVNILLNTLLLQNIQKRKNIKKWIFFSISLILILSILIFYMYRRFEGIQRTFFANDYDLIFELFFPIPLQTTYYTLKSWIYVPSTIDIIGSLKNVFINIMIAILISNCLITFIKNKRKFIFLTVIISFILELGKWLLRLGIYDADDIIVRVIIGILTFKFYEKFLTKGGG